MESSRAFLRLVLITAASLFTLFLALIVLRLVALSGPAPVAPRPFSKPLIFASGSLEHGPLYSEPSYRAVIDLSPQVIPVLEVRVTSDRQWFLMGPGPLEQYTNGKGPSERLSWEEVQSLQLKEATAALHPIRLEDFLKAHNLPAVMVIVHNQEVAGAKSLVSLLGERDEPQVTWIWSPTHRLNRELRKLRPYWHFGADQVQLTQWRLFVSFGLDPLAPAEFEWLPVNAFNSAPQKMGSLQDEILRRKIPRLRWVGQPSEISFPLTEDDLGILTNRPKDFLSLIPVDPSAKTH